ncbi:hypothetical protein GGF32_007582 [Allomyces javanicus]|nr:hypothetical protein GGF32_007582 [Allomyces javanicus]
MSQLSPDMMNCLSVLMSTPTTAKAVETNSVTSGSPQVAGTVSQSELASGMGAKKRKDDREHEWREDVEQAITTETMAPVPNAGATTASKLALCTMSRPSSSIPTLSLMLMAKINAAASMGSPIAAGTSANSELGSRMGAKPGIGSGTGKSPVVDTVTSVPAPAAPSPKRANKTLSDKAPNCRV